MKLRLAASVIQDVFFRKCQQSKVLFLLKEKFKYLPQVHYCCSSALAHS